MLGLLLGAALVFAKDFPIGVFRTPQQVKEATGIQATALPLISGRASSKSDLSRYALDMPYTRFAETIRTISALVKNAQAKNSGKVFCVVSAAPGEGKTVVATNLARLISTYGGARTLLIDADFHRRSLSQKMAPQAAQGLREALEDPTNLSNFIVKGDNAEPDLLPCAVQGRVPNAADLLGSSNMEALIDMARATYDVVIIKVPPIAAVVDFKMIAPLCDGFIFVAEWSKTSQRVVLESLSEAAVLGERALCIVLNRTNPKALASIEKYKGVTCRDYYQQKSFV
jgi:polysaccharide biosynthesis transport protein